MRSRRNRPGLAARLAARRRAAVLLSIVLDLPVSRVVHRLTGTPRTETGDVDGVPLEIVRPAGSGPWPTWVFVNGAHPLRRKEPVVWRLSQGLARAGYMVVVPDLPGLGNGQITMRTSDAAVSVTAFAMRLPDARDGRVALVGASMGAGLALLAASRCNEDDRVSAVAAVAPFADLEKLICLATTGSYPGEGGLERHDVTNLHRRVLARSLVALLEDSADRKSLLATLERVRDDDDPLAHLPTHAENLGPAAASVVRVLRNSDPERFPELCRDLPLHVVAALSALSPARSCTGLRAPVEIVVPPSDVYFPPGEARTLAHCLPDARVTVTRSLDHTRPAASLARLADLRRLDGFVVRGLAAAAA